jgi:hypothetical protein
VDDLSITQKDQEPTDWKEYGTLAMLHDTIALDKGGLRIRGLDEGVNENRAHHERKSGKGIGIELIPIIYLQPLGAL